MKLQDLTIDQFQRIAALEFSPVLTDYDKRAGVVAIVEGVDVSLVREMPAKGLTKRYKTIIAEWNELPTLAYRRRFKAGGKWWIPTVFTDELTAGQLIDLMDTDTTDEKKLVQNLHRIMATLCREAGSLVTSRRNTTGQAIKSGPNYSKPTPRLAMFGGWSSFFC
jgi:hypothetical protein